MNPEMLFVGPLVFKAFFHSSDIHKQTFHLLSNMYPEMLFVVPLGCKAFPTILSYTRLPLLSNRYPEMLFVCPLMFHPVALKMAKIVNNFGLSECSWVKAFFTILTYTSRLNTCCQVCTGDVYSHSCV